MEEDTGKSLHVGGATGRIHGADHSLVDYNRAGIPLIEIVTKTIPGTREQAPLVAKAYVAQLRDVLLGLGVSDVRMEQGSLRCDVNLSLAPKDSGELGTRTETKNVNSLRSVERAVRYEIGRHAAVLVLRRVDPAGDPALARGHRGHDLGPREVRRRGLPLLPGARPGAGRAVPRVGRGAQGRAARAAARPPRPAAAGVGLHRPRDARHGGRRRARPGRGDHRGRRLARRGPQVVALGPRPSGQRAGRGPPGAPGLARRRRARPGARRRGQDQRQAGPSGVRGRAGRRGRPRRRSSPPVGSRSSPTRASCPPPSTGPSRPTPTWPPRSATARSPRPVR